MQIKSNVVNIWTFLKRYIHLEIVALLATIVTIAVKIRANWLIKNLIDDALIPKDLQLLIHFCLLFAGLNFIAFLGGLLKNYLFTKVGQGTIFDVRSKLYEHILKLPKSYFDNTKKGDIISRLLNDVGNIQNVVSKVLVEFATSLLTVVGILTWLFIINWKLTLTLLIVIPVYVLLAAKISKLIHKYSGEAQQAYSDVTSAIHETTEGIEVIKSFSIHDNMLKRFQAKLRNLVRAIIKREVCGILMNSFGEGIMYPFQGLFFGLGGYWFITQGEPSIGVLFAYLNYAGVLIPAFMTLINVVGQFSQAFANFDRIFSLLQTKPENDGELIPVPPLNSTIQMKNVSFSYSDNIDILKDININIESGETVAIVGSSGEGKSTILKLLLKQYRPAAGYISFDSTNIQSLNSHNYLKHIAYVPQDTFLFNCSIEENILIANENAKSSDVIEAAKKAQLHDFITSLPEGYKTVVGDRGVKLSGGEKQRLAIARAIIKEPSILIMDEPTANLDAITEDKLWKNVLTNFKNRTVIIVAHRLASAKMADKIIVIKEGQIAEQGEIDELLASDGAFNQLYKKQFSYSNK